MTEKNGEQHIKKQLWQSERPINVKIIRSASELKASIKREDIPQHTSDEFPGQQQRKGLRLSFRQTIISASQVMFGEFFIHMVLRR